VLRLLLLALRRSLLVVELPRGDLAAVECATLLGVQSGHAVLLLVVALVAAVARRLGEG